MDADDKMDIEKADEVLDKALANSKVSVFPQDSPTKYYGGKPGRYQCFCYQCGNPFYGDKRDLMCPQCDPDGSIKANLTQDARPAPDMPAPQATCERLPGAGIGPNPHGICDGCKVLAGMAMRQCPIDLLGRKCNCCEACRKECEDLL